MNILKCDCCSQFAQEEELETVTLTIRKHKGCDVNTLFGKASVAPQVAPQRMNLASDDRSFTPPPNTPFASIKPVITEDMPPIPQGVVDKIKEQAK